jgi:two-component system nitrate/nitrite response regulator NarL
MRGVGLSDLATALILIDWGQDEAAMAIGLARLRQEFPQSYVVVLSDGYSHSHTLCAFRSGTRGCIVKQTNSEAIVKSLQLICLGEHVFPVRFVEWLCQAGLLPAHPSTYHELDTPDSDGNFESLSPREIEVFAVLCEGKSNKAIARRCGIAEATVKVHVKAILRKLKARNRTEAAIWARDHMFPANGHPFGI